MTSFEILNQFFVEHGKEGEKFRGDSVPVPIFRNVSSSKHYTTKRERERDASKSG